MGNVLSVTAKLFRVLRHSSSTPKVSLLSGNKRDPGKEERDGFKPSLRVALRGKNYSLHGKLVHKEEVSGSKVQKPCKYVLQLRIPSLIASYKVIALCPLHLCSLNGTTWLITGENWRGLF